MIEADQLPVLTGPRVTLRWLTEQDVDALYGIFSTPDVMTYWSCPPYQEIGEAEALLTSIKSGFESKTLFQWGVASNKDDSIIGTCTLFQLDAGNRRAEIGYVLGRQHWGQGYMGEALTRLLEFCFKDLDLIRLEADVDPRNTASIKSLERLGFQREGFLRERWIVGGNIMDSLFYGLLKKDWDTR